jgi:pyruvate,orthophosphate dikinase
VVTDPDAAETRSATGEFVIPARPTTSPDLPEAEATSRSKDFVTRGLCASTPVAIRLTPQDREQFGQLLEHERAQIDRLLIAAAYDEFCEFNAELKAAVTAWQMKDAST